MFKVGRVCKKSVGREAGRFCVVVEKKDDTFVVVDGDVRRRRCNVKHLKPVGTVLKISKGSSTETVRKAMEEAGFKVTPKTKPKPPKEKPVKKRVLKAREKVPKEKAPAQKRPAAKKPAKKKAPAKKVVKKAPAKKKAAPKKTSKKPAKKKPEKTVKKPAKKPKK
jgi:large subunit ribosomal protein L14e